MELILPDDDDLVAQLSGRKYALTEASKIKIESKDAVKKRGQPSPDEADCVLLLCLPVKPPKRRGVRKEWLRASGRAWRCASSRRTRALIEKADTPVQVTEQEAYNAGDWITPRHDMRGLAKLVENSTILPQCIRAYKNNIAGFGIGVRYIDDVEETPEMAAEFQRAEEIIELLNIEQDTKEVFEDVIEARETYGIAYLEVIRNVAGEVVQIEFVKETESVWKSRPLDPYITTTYWHHGQEVERKKRYCKYKQEIGGKVVYFKEFGDPRVMDMRDGKYLGDGRDP